MGDKKKPGRFTLQFNLEDPQQRTVSDLLEQQGRHKAQFLTNAVLLYTYRLKPLEHSSNPPTIEEEILEKMLLSIMKKYPQLITAPPNELPESKCTPAPTTPCLESWGEPMEDDAMKAISDTLAAFRQK